jgi:hypothetical protein
MRIAALEKDSQKQNDQILRYRKQNQLLEKVPIL